jgi:hypothetical protein
MRKIRKMWAVGVLAAAAVTSSLAVATPASATAGELCNARISGAQFYVEPGGAPSYFVAPWGGIRDDGGQQNFGGVIYHLGHGNNHSTRWFRLSDSTCH